MSDRDDDGLQGPDPQVRLLPPGVARIREKHPTFAMHAADRLAAFQERQLRDDAAFHARYADRPRLTVAVAGSSGMIGTQLTALLVGGGHRVRRMIREDRVGPGEISWDPRSGRLDPADLEGVDVVVNLAGRSIATRWTAAARREIRESRVRGTHLIARTLAELAGSGSSGGSVGPRVLVQASAVGIYGAQRPGELLTEDDARGEGFLADVVREWEASTRAAADAGIRVPLIRTGVVLSDGGGSLLPQLPLYLAGVGGRLAPKDAVTSWITLDDIVRVIAHAVLTPSLDGPVNAVAPTPVDAREFARALGGTLRRPAVLPVPSVGPRLLLGADAARELVAADQRVSDERLRASGFVPAHRSLRPALEHVLWR
ncbi:TIGR01777 family oxidoreductase [Brachybacterium sp. DNPG3]